MISCAERTSPRIVSADEVARGSLSALALETASSQRTAALRLVPAERHERELGESEDDLSLTATFAEKRQGLEESRCSFPVALCSSLAGSRPQGIGPDIGPDFG